LRKIRYTGSEYSIQEEVMLEKYKEYLKKLDQNLKGYFESQKEYICCKSGCSDCCRKSYYPVSEVEYDYVREGFNKLDETLKETIQQEAVQILKDRRKFLKTNADIMAFKYVCPFLRQDACVVYHHRPLLCRSHGLIYKDIEKENKIKVPNCVNIGLNYANIWDKDRKVFCDTKIKVLGLKPPEAFDLSYSVLMNKAADVDFGDIRMIFEWIIFDIPNYEELTRE
jgi:Fe-S-cluster containining protein